MALTIQNFKDAFPELARSGDTVIGAKLADAERYVALGFGDDAAVRDQAVSYWAAHLVALAPGGEPLRLDPNKDPDGARSIYERQFNEFLRFQSGCPMVI